MNYDTLIGDAVLPGSIKYWINYSRIDAAGILTDAQAWIYSKLRVRQMAALADVPLVAGASFAEFPTGYLDPIALGVPVYAPRIHYNTPEDFRMLCGWDEDGVMPDGEPTRWSDIDNKIQLNSTLLENRTARMIYYRTPAALGPSNQTNFLTDRYSVLLRRVCTMFAAEARKEWDTMKTLEVLCLNQIDEIKVESDLALRGLELDFHWGDER